MSKTTSDLLVKVLDLLFQSRLDVNMDSSSPTFPMASATFNDSSFVRLQRELGLLQTVVLSGLPTDDKDITLSHVTHVIGADIPWLPLAEGTDSWQVNPGARVAAMNNAFRRYREGDEGVQEFAGWLLDARKHSELEEAVQALVVSDGEQSFISLLWVLTHALKESGAPAEISEWLDSQKHLPTVFRLSGIDGPGNGGKSYSRLLSDHYWTDASFGEAMAALGLINQNSEETARFSRMIDWLEKNISSSLFEDELTLISGEKIKAGSLFGAVVDSWSPTMKGVASALASALQTIVPVNFESKPRRSSMVRFNVTGEYLIRRDESIDRTFFATAISQLPDLDQSGPRLTAFALGTLYDLECQSLDEAVHRFQCVRQLVSAISDFGLTQRWIEESKWRLPMRTLNHVIAGPLSTAVDKFGLVKHDLENSIRDQRLREEVSRTFSRLSIVQLALRAAVRLTTGGDSREYGAVTSRSFPIESLRNLTEEWAVREFFDSESAGILFDRTNIKEAGWSKVRAKGGADEWTVLFYIVLKNAFQAARAAMHPEREAPRVVVELREEPRRGLTGPILVATVKNSTVKMRQELLVEMNEAINGNRTQLARDSTKANSHGLGVSIAGQIGRRLGLRGDFEEVEGMCKLTFHIPWEKE